MVAVSVAIEPKPRFARTSSAFVAPVPPALIGKVLAVITPSVPVYNALLEAVPAYPLLVIIP